MGRFSESWEYLFRSQVYLSSMHLQSLHIISNYFPSMLRWYGHLVILRYRYITINKIKSRVFLFFMYFQIMLSRDFQIIISSSTVCFSGNYFVENVTFFIVIWCVLRSFHILPHVKSFFHILRILKPSDLPTMTILVGPNVEHRWQTCVTTHCEANRTKSHRLDRKIKNHKDMISASTLVFQRTTSWHHREVVDGCIFGAKIAEFLKIGAI